MTEPKAKATEKKAGAAASRKKSPSPPIAERPVLFAAIESFILENTNFEATIPTADVIRDMGRLLRLQDAFELPLKHRILSMGSALQWAFFLSAAVPHSIVKGDAPFAAPNAFDVAAAMTLIAMVYDKGYKDTVLAHFAEPSDDEDDEDEDDEDEDDEDAGAGAPAAAGAAHA